MSKTKFLTLMLAVAAVAAAFAADPVLMNVAGKDVRLSEFEYLFNKNNAQQQQPQSVDDYIKLFTDYKLKVAAAEAAGLDTTAKFREEMARYSDELAEPYMRDMTVADSLARVAYSHMLRNVDVSHIMTSDRALADSLHALIAAGADFEALADSFSIDPMVKRNHGHVGYISAGMFPYEIEEVAYDTPVGKLADVFTTRYGHHIIKVHGQRDDRGEVKVRHILKLTQGLSPADTLEKVRQIDSIYTALKAGADFQELASRLTDDPSGKDKGGDLPWFGAGRMVPQFEAASFALADGEISKPVRTDYGYHIILKEGSRKQPSFEDSRKAIDAQMARDSRSTMPVRRATERYMARYGAAVDNDAMAGARAVIDSAGQNVRSAIEGLASYTRPLARIGNASITASDAIALINPGIQPRYLKEALGEAVNYLLGRKAREMAKADLATTEPEYANLMNEYHDGILLYEISDREVWNRPNADTEGLTRYFEAHRKDYTWDKPRYKGYLIMAENDSLAYAARNMLNSASTPDDSLSIAVRKKFGTDVKVERVLAAAGANQVIDYVAFGGPRPKPVGRWTSFVPYRYRIISQPEEAFDVKGQLSIDYQKELEKEWLERLRRTYKVKVNERTLKTLHDKYPSAQ